MRLGRTKTRLQQLVALVVGPSNEKHGTDSPSELDSWPLSHGLVLLVIFFTFLKMVGFVTILKQPPFWASEYFGSGQTFSFHPFAPSRVEVSKSNKGGLGLRSQVKHHREEGVCVCVCVCVFF